MFHENDYYREEGELLTPGDITVGVLAGGRGDRLKEVTKGEIPKVLIEITDGKSILDLVLEGLSRQGFKKFVFLLNEEEERFGREIYRHILNSGYRPECLFERPGEGSAGAFKNLIEFVGNDKPLMALTADMLFNWEALPGFLKSYKNGAAHCLVSSHTTDIMDTYNGLIVASRGAIVGDEKLDWWKKEYNTVGLKRVAKGGAIIFDPDQYLDYYKLYIRICKPAGPPDLFTGIYPMIQEINRRRIQLGKSSILNAYYSEGVILDIGTPERFAYVRRYLEREGLG